MGLKNEEGFGKFINVIDGKFRIRANEGEEGAVSRINKKGVVVWEHCYNSFTAKLVGISTRDGAFGKEWIFSFQDEGDVYQLQLGYSSGNAQAILKLLPNVDVSKEMKIQTSLKVDGDKKTSSIFISQDGKTLKHKYTRDNPQGMPDLKEVIVNGQKTWDSTDRMEWLYQMVQRDIIPHLPERKQYEPSQQGSYGVAADPVAVAGNPEDDF